MKRLDRKEMKEIVAGSLTPPGGGDPPPGGGGSGGGSNPNTICLFKSTTCGNLCYDLGSTATCASQLPGFLPSCHYTAQQVQSCAGA